MKNVFVFIFLLSYLLSSCSTSKSVSNHKDDTIYKVVDKPASFPGGNSEMYKFIGNYLKYPPKAIEANISARVSANFVIEINGEISNIQIIKGIGFGLDEEVIRIIELMPKWEPAEHKGKKVRSEVSQSFFTGRKE